jgi:F0F1-type ATP synthase alpha subunit
MGAVVLGDYERTLLKAILLNVQVVFLEVPVGPRISGRVVKRARSAIDGKGGLMQND